MKTLPKNTWIIIPAYNEEKYLDRFLTKLAKKAQNIIIVDDGSKDDTVLVAGDYTEHVIHHPVNLGKGAALKTGADYAFERLNAEAVIFMDGDDQHDPNDLEKFVEALKKHEVVFGVRDLSGQMPVMRQLGNRFVSLLVLLLYGKYVPDILGGFNAITKEAYSQVTIFARAYDIELELVVKTILADLNYTTVSTKTIYHDLDRGMTLLDAGRIVLELLSWRITK